MVNVLKFLRRPEPQFVTYEVRKNIGDRITDSFFVFDCIWLILTFGSLLSVSLLFSGFWWFL